MLPDWASVATMPLDHHTSPAYRLIGMSVLQSVASAVLAPSLRHVADMLALNWRSRLTRSAFAKYLVGEPAGPPHSAGAVLPGLAGKLGRVARAWLRPVQDCCAPAGTVMFIAALLQRLAGCRQHLLHHIPAGGHAGHRPAADARHW